MKNILLFDCGNLVYRNLHVAVNQDPDDNYDFRIWKSLFLNSFLQTISKFSPDRVVVCIDSEDNWRKSVYSGYKIDRAAKRAKSKINFTRFFPIMNNYLEDLQKTFTNIVFLKVNNTEADDLIGTLCDKCEDQMVTIVSSDKDFHQCINNRVKQYDPIKRDFVECLNPSRELQIKVLTGDSGDCVPNIKPKIGPKTASKLLSEGLQDLLDSDEQVRKNYERNKLLIDLSNIPQELKNEIWSEYNKYQLQEIKAGSIFNFLMRNRLQKIVDEFNSYEKSIKRLA